jgi:DNA-binding winged helix-turn-helix (wHTH) protein
MYFILNKTVKFYPDINELSIINEQHNSIVLSKPASRLLLTLIQNANDVVSRDYLLKNVWEDYGYTPSNNNLYMAISELRKALSSLGGEGEVLVTIPRVGLKLEAMVDVLEKTDKHDNKSEINLENEINSEFEISTERGIETHSLKSKLYTKLKIAASLSLILLSSGHFFLKYKKTLPIIDSNDEYVFKYGACDVFSHSLSLGLVSNNDELKKGIINKLQEHNISCDSARKNIYFQTSLKRSGKARNYFIGACTLIKNSNTRKCETITTSDELEQPI